MELITVVFKQKQDPKIFYTTTKMCERLYIILRLPIERHKDVLTAEISKQNGRRNQFIILFTLTLKYYFITYK